MSLESRHYCRAALLVGTLGATTCTPFKEDPRTGSADAADPGSGLQTDTDASCDPTQPFGPPTEVPGFRDNTINPGTLRLSRDYLTAYFSADGLTNAPSAGYVDLYQASRTTPADPFSDFQSFSSVNARDTRDVQYDPTVDGDGSMLVYDRVGIGGQPPDKIYYATRASPSGPFVPRGLLPNVNSTGFDCCPFVLEGRSALYFGSNRAADGNSTIYRSAWNGDGFDDPVLVPELRFSDGFSGSPVVTPDELVIYFNSNRPLADGTRPARIWTATRASSAQSFSAPTNVHELNQFDNLLEPTFVTRDGCSLYLRAGDRPSPMVYVASKPRRSI